MIVIHTTEPTNRGLKKLKEEALEEIIKLGRADELAKESMAVFKIKNGICEAV
jgi:hypothetical protein